MRPWLCLLSLAFLGGPIPANAAALKAVATTSDLGALAQAVGGKRLAVSVLARPTEDPHFVDPRPSLIVTLNRADVLIEGGAELETGWLPPLVAQARNDRIVPGAPGRIMAREAVTMLEVPERLDRAQGDLHALGNPHFLVDPANGQRVARAMAEALSRLDPGGRDSYATNLQAFEATIEARWVEWQRLLAPYRDQRVVSYHNSWPYFGQRFGLRMDLFLEPKPGIPPSPAHLAQVIQTMKDERVPVILVEPHISRRTAEKVARESGAVLAEVSQFPGGMAGTEGDYAKTIDQIVRALAGAFAQRTGAASGR